MTVLFDRRCRVLIGRQPADSFDLKTPDAMVIENLRCTFKVERDLKPGPNKLEVVVFNLSQQSRAELVGKGFRIVLQAGYEGSVSQIFSGDVRTFSHEHQGPDWVTKMQAGDGERAFAFARVNQSWKPGINLKDVAIATVKALQTDPGNAIEKISQKLTGQFASGYVQFSQASTELTRLLQPAGLEWSIQDGRVEILEPRETLAATVPVISPTTGLIGTPALGAPDAKGAPTKLKVKSLLVPLLRPGQKFKLESDALNGFYKASKVVHAGDTRGGDWYTDIEALPTS